MVLNLFAAFQVYLEGVHHQKPKYHVTVLIIGIGLIVGVTLLLILSLLLWKVSFQYFSLVLKLEIHTVSGSLDVLMQVKG